MLVTVHVIKQFIYFMNNNHLQQEIIKGTFYAHHSIHGLGINSWCWYRFESQVLQKRWQVDTKKIHALDVAPFIQVSKNWLARGRRGGRLSFTEGSFLSNFPVSNDLLLFTLSNTWREKKLSHHFGRNLRESEKDIKMQYLRQTIQLKISYADCKKKKSFNIVRESGLLKSTKQNNYNTHAFGYQSHLKHKTDRSWFYALF